MKCPVCSGSLITKRTLLRHNNTVKRERYCTNCNNKLFTTEIFQNDLEAERQQYVQEIRKLDNQLRIYKRKFDEIMQSGKHLYALLGELINKVS